jgi:hypothetical protein
MYTFPGADLYALMWQLDGTGPGPTGGSTTGEMEGKETTKLGSEGTTPLPATLDDMPEEVRQ